ncbi:MFS transporter [Nonomuraea sp. NPDC050556]|uniref:MFS transporter n=1 Tax=Nonomuraea sp. NPDC050556 TaxID=3364369 RepID=UPI0037B60002
MSIGRVASITFTGNVIDFYEFYLYGTAAALVFGPLFFPSLSPVAGTVAAFATYAVGFVARPLGATAFGHIGDRYGRRRVLLSSLLMTGLATTFVGFLPTFAQIGVAAPLLLVCLQFLQGFGLGGEWGGAIMLTAEHAPARRRALWASMAQAGPSLGFLLANGAMLALSATLTDAQFTSWGWRIPFWATSVLVVVGLLLRLSLEETPAFEAMVRRKETVRVPLVELFRGHWRTVLLIAGALTSGFAVNYAVATWSISHGTHNLGLSRSTVLACVMVAIAVKGAGMPLMAMLGDRYGRRTMSMIGTFAMLAWSFPLIILIQTGKPVLMTLGFVVAILCLIAMLAVQGAYLSELFHVKVRATGASVSYGLAAVLGGALTPLIATALATDQGPPWAVAGYLVALGCVSLLCFRAMPETRETGR